MEIIEKIAKMLILSLLSLATIFVVLQIFAQAVISFLEFLVTNGVFKNNGFMEQMVMRGISRKVTPMLGAIGFNKDHFEAIRNGLYKVKMKPKKDHYGKGLLSHRLIYTLKNVIRELGQTHFYKELDNYYADTMGAMLYPKEMYTNLSSILFAWLEKLKDSEHICDFDCILTSKLGNPTLIREVCCIHEKAKPIIWKPKVDPSRIEAHPAILPHKINFEGLEAFLAENQEFIQKYPDYKFKVIVVDDNCTAGKNLCEAIEEFNELITSDEHICFEPIKHAVTLFGIKADGTENNFKRVHTNLHTILSLGKEELKQIYDNENVLKLCKNQNFVSSCKQGYGCDSSRKLKC